MKRLLGSLAFAGVLVAAPHHSASAQASDSTKKVAAKTKMATKKKSNEAHPRLVAAMTHLTESKKELEAAPDDFGGHKAEAIKSIDEAMKHLKLAMAADKK